MVAVAAALAFTVAIGRPVTPAAGPRQGAQAVTAPAEASPSVERLRDALRRPSGLRLPPATGDTPVFRVEIEVTDWSTPSILDTIRQELAASSVHQPPFQVGRTPPLASVDLLDLAAKIRASRRDGAERDVRRRVRQELAAFCAVHDCSVVEESK